MQLISKAKSKYTERQVCLLNYLKTRVSTEKCFLKAKHIAKETGLSSREVGTNMGILAESCHDFSIIKYSYSTSTTWMVTASRQ